MIHKSNIQVWMLADLAIGLAGTAFVLAAIAMALLATRKAGAGGADQARAAELKATLEVAELVNTKLKVENSVLVTMNKELDEKVRRLEPEEPMLRQELLGLKGLLKKTVFVIDASRSMASPPQVDKRSGLASPSNKSHRTWDEVVSTTANWIEFLPVESFRVITFNEETTEFPSVSRIFVDQRFKPKAVQFLLEQRPHGGTNMELALKRAIEMQPSAIILFTDGQPTETSTGKADRAQCQRILDLLRGNPKIPVNVVALGHWWSDPGFADFLKAISQISGGGFIGM